MQHPALVGIDVSARTLVVCIEAASGRELLEFPNTSGGHRSIIRRLTKKGRSARVGLEASGIYSLDLALALQAADRIEVMVVNPRASRNFAKAYLQRSKTDERDAVVLVEFVRRMPFQPWAAPSLQALELRALCRRMEALVKARAREKNRLHAARSCRVTPEFVRNDIEVNIRHLGRRIARLEEKAVDLIWDDAARMRHQLVLLTSVKGIARTSAVQILGELSVLPEDLTVRELVAHAGLDPRTHESGESVDKPPRISRAGNEHLRAALFMPALVACRYEPNVKAFYEKLLRRGKKPKQAVVAVMRKLLHSIYGMLKTGTEFDGQLFYATPVATP